MTDLHNLPKTTEKKKKILGRGGGSGRGKTSGRGTKGQKSRGKISVKLGEGGVSFVRRLPLYRGKYRNKPFHKKPLVVNLKLLNCIPKDSEVDINLLTHYHLVDKRDAEIYGVKILGDGQITIPLIVMLPCSKRAMKKIEAAGGKVKFEIR